MLKGKLVTGSELLGKLSGVIGANPTLITKNITANGTYTASSDNADGYSEVDVDVQPTLITKNITANGTYTASSDNADGYSEVDVDVQPTLITKNITANGTYTASSDNADGYSEVNVDVAGIGGVPASDNGTIDYFNPSGNTHIAVIYKKYSLNGVTWSYISSGLSTPCFATPIPSGLNVYSGTDTCSLEGYSSRSEFWNVPNNDKCVAVGGSNINVSDFSFNGNVNAFAQFMNSKSIYLWARQPVIVNV